MLKRDDGGVLAIVAIVLPVLVLLSAGGVSTYAMYASGRELQTAADQAALAGAIALPPFDPNVIVDNAPFPIPSTDPLYALLPPDVGRIVPRMGDLIPDPRRVACEVGRAQLDPNAATVVNTLKSQDVFDPPLGDDGKPAQTVCENVAVYPRIEPNPDNTTPVDCTNRLVQRVAEDAGSLDPSVDTVLDPVLAPVQARVDTVVRMPLNHVLPAAFTPRMHVDVYAGIEPPMLTLITSRKGGTMHAAATAYRRIKNAVVVPIFPAQQATLVPNPITHLLPVNPATGKPWEPIDFMTDPVNLNTALHAQQATLIAAITDADDRLDTVMQEYRLPCDHLLHNLRQDLRDVYDPPAGPAPAATDIVDAAIAAANSTASAVGAARPDPSDPDSLAGEAFYLIGVSVDQFMRPIAATQIPILDVALVTMRKVGDGSYEAAVVNAANAYGVFRASLVE
jgi:hypothetical protein